MFEALIAKQVRNFKTKTNRIDMRILVLFFALYSGIIASAQISAITQDGRKVILYPDNTWRYTDGEAPSEVVKITKIEIDTAGSVRTYFSKGNQLLVMEAGKIISNDFQSIEIKYYDKYDGNEQLIGKIKALKIENTKIELNYNDRFDGNEGKLKSVQYNKENFQIKYFDKYDMNEKLLGKVKSIANRAEKISIEYNDRYDGSEGKLKRMKGQINGIIVKYLE